MGSEGDPVTHTMEADAGLTGPVQGTLPKFQRIINKGAFGEVYLGTLDTGEDVAVKVIPIDGNTNHVALNQELQLCRRLKHPYIVHTYDVIHTDTAVYVIQEYCARGDLFEVVTPLVGIGDEQRIRKYFRQLVAATAYLHSEGLVHRDIKPENVVLTAEDDIRLIDFGLSGPEEEDVEPCVGTVPYMAPEVYHGARGQKNSSKAADIFSLGIVLYVMLRGCYPWDAPSHHERTFECFVRKGFSFCQPWAVALDEIFAGCLHLDPKKRLTAEELLARLDTECDWRLDTNAGGPQRLSYSVVPEHESDLQRPLWANRGRDVDIVFTDDIRSSGQGSTDDEYVDTMPEAFNPLVDLPRRCTRPTSECDSGLEIHFDVEADMERVCMALQHHSSLSGAEDDDDSIPRWSWRHTDSSRRGTQLPEKEGQSTELWADLTNDMSFATLPAFGDPAPQQLPREPSRAAVKLSREQSEDDCRRGNTKWGDMSWDMSFSRLPRFDDGVVSSAPTPPAGEGELLGAKRHCLFTVGEIQDDSECKELSEDTEDGATHTATPGSVDAAPSLAHREDEHEGFPGSGVLPCPVAVGNGVQCQVPVAGKPAAIDSSGLHTDLDVQGHSVHECLRGGSGMLHERAPDNGQVELPRGLVTAAASQEPEKLQKQGSSWWTRRIMGTRSLGLPDTHQPLQGPRPLQPAIAPLQSRSAVLATCRSELGSSQCLGPRQDAGGMACVCTGGGQGCAVHQSRSSMGGAGCADAGEVCIACMLAALARLRLCRDTVGRPLFDVYGPMGS